jgi:hypothetical protein
MVHYFVSKFEFDMESMDVTPLSPPTVRTPSPTTEENQVHEQNASE